MNRSHMGRNANTTIKVCNVHIGENIFLKLEIHVILKGFTGNPGYIFQNSAIYLNRCPLQNRFNKPFMI